jgi:hypothetical protein
MDILSRQLTTVIPDAGLKCNSVYGQISAFKSVPAALSLCITIQMTQEQYDQFRDSGVIIGCPNGVSNFCLYKRPASGWLGGLCWGYTNAAATTESLATKICFYNTVMSTITDGKTHCLVCCVNPTEKKIKAYVDGVYVNDGYDSYKTFTATPTAFITSNSFGIGTNTTYTLNGGCTISNVKYFNFDISAEGAAYSLEDYQNNRDIPDGTSGIILNLHNKLSGTTWQDESGNGHNMTLSGDYEITDE